MDRSGELTSHRRTASLIIGGGLAAAILIALLALGTMWYINVVRASMLSWQGYSALMRGDHDESLRLHLESVRHNDRDYSTWYNLGVTYSRLECFEQAADAYHRAADLNPNDVASRAVLAETRAFLALQKGKAEEAERLYRESLLLDNSNAHVWHGLGSALHRAGRYEEALAANREALRLAPGHAEYMFGLGSAQNGVAYTAYISGDYERSAAMYREALLSIPDHAATWYSLSTACFAMDRFNEAREAALKAVELDPENASYRDMLDLLRFVGSGRD